MGKGRKPNKPRQASGKWNADLKLKKDDIMPLFQGIGLTCVIAFLFYKSLVALLIGVGVVPFWIHLNRVERRERRKARMLVEFKEFMILIVQGLQTGYSLERGIKQAENELKRLYPNDSVLLPYAHVMNQKISMNVQLEKAFMEFAMSVGLEEAISLAEIIAFAKRSGGDYGKNIRETAMKIEDNLAVKQDIETITTEKRLELKVMCVMPIGILAYITLTSKGFVAPLYGNLAGVFIMTACLIAYGFLIMLGKKIIDIKV